MRSPQTVLAFIFAIGGLPNAFADSCPNLAGDFHCPSRGENPAFDMKVRQAGNLHRVVTYTWEYTGPFEPVVFLASTRGVLNTGGNYGLCRNHGLSITKNLNDLSDSLRNVVNEAGNYIVTTFLGEPVMTCIRFI